MDIVRRFATNHVATSTNAVISRNESNVRFHMRHERPIAYCLPLYWHRDLRRRARNDCDVIGSNRLAAVRMLLPRHWISTTTRMSLYLKYGHFCLGIGPVYWLDSGTHRHLQ